MAEFRSRETRGRSGDKSGEGTGKAEVWWEGRGWENGGPKEGKESSAGGEKEPGCLREWGT